MTSLRSRALSLVAATAALLATSSAAAQATTTKVTPEGRPLSVLERRGRYALPFSMRPAIAPNLLRLDAALAFQDQATTLASTLTAGGKPFESQPDFGIYLRGALVHQAPEVGESGTALSNPLAFVLYTPEIAPKLRLPLFAGVTAPFGMGGTPGPARSAMAGGIYARQAMDNALFATNYITPTVGVGIAWVDQGWTVQLDTQLLQLLRTRNAEVDADAARTNFTSGLSVGYVVLPPVLLVQAEIHYQRWLSTPAVVVTNPAARDQFTFGGGLRANVPLSTGILWRPGVAYFQPLDDPMAGAGYRIVQLDSPFAF
jgi:hypothetical protein